MESGRQIAPQEVVRGSWLIVDVRSASEYVAEHVPASLHMPLDQIEASAPALRQFSRVALLCKAGTRATMAQRLLAAHGIDATVVDGGLDSWKRIGFSTVSVLRTRWSLERQVRLVTGLLVLIGALASVAFAHGWIWLAVFVGAGLTFAGATDICMMGSLLARMPWNRVRSSA